MDLSLNAYIYLFYFVLYNIYRIELAFILRSAVAVAAPHHMEKIAYLGL
jgi:hypothetical protein